MKWTAEVRPINSIVFIHGANQGITPLAIWGGSILATNSCIIVRCFPEIDGSMQINFGDMGEVGLGVPADYVGIIETVGPELLITTVEETTVLSMPVGPGTREVRIWLSHPRWPETVTIGVGPKLSPELQNQVRAIPDDATQSGWHPMEGSSSLFLCDGGEPRLHRDFDPRESPSVLASGCFVPIGQSIKLRFLTALPNDLARLPSFNTQIETPTKEVWIFDFERQGYF